MKEINKKFFYLLFGLLLFSCNNEVSLNLQKKIKGDYHQGLYTRYRYVNGSVSEIMEVRENHTFTIDHDKDGKILYISDDLNFQGQSTAQYLNGIGFSIPEQVDSTLGYVRTIEGLATRANETDGFYAEGKLEISFKMNESIVEISGTKITD